MRRRKFTPDLMRGTRGEALLRRAISVAGPILLLVAPLLESSPTMIGFQNPFQLVIDVRLALSSPGPAEMIVRKPSGLTVRILFQAGADYRARLAVRM